MKQGDFILYTNKNCGVVTAQVINTDIRAYVTVKTNEGVRSVFFAMIIEKGSKLWTFNIDSRNEACVYEVEFVDYDGEILTVRSNKTEYLYSAENLFISKFAAKNAFMAALKVEIEWRQALYNEMED